MSDLKLVTVCIPTYNREQDLKTLISTIPSPIKIEISNNGTELDLDTDRIRVIKQDKTIPMFDNWNAAAKMADTDYIFITSDDDIYNDNAFDIVAKALSEYPDLDLYAWGVNIVDGDYKIISRNEFTNLDYEIFKPGELFKKYPYSIPFRMPSICVRREFAQNLGFFNTKMQITAADSDFLHKFFLLGNCYLGKEVISGYRVWDGSFTNTTNATEKWFIDLDVWVNSIINLASDHEIDNIIPVKFRDEIMYLNICSSLATMKKNKNSLNMKVKFIRMLINNNYLVGIINILKVSIRLFYK
tara:strand:- start:9097 stop:9996 length:900 start_codon:yes stop_codon:yes gene_type:complete